MQNTILSRKILNLLTIVALVSTHSALPISLNKKLTFKNQDYPLPEYIKTSKIHGRRGLNSIRFLETVMVI